MAQTDKIPETVDDVKKIYFRKLWQWFSRTSIGLKVIFLALLLIIMLLLARFNLLGDSGYQFARLIIPVKISGIDPPLAHIPLLFNFEIQDETGRRQQGKLGASYYSGDGISFSFKAGAPCWLLIFGIDSEDIFPVFGDNFEPQYIEKNIDYPPLEFYLNKTEGDEIYYAIASHENFGFEKNIKPNLKEIFPQYNSKGLAKSQYQLNLPDHFVAQSIWFRHQSK